MQHVIPITDASPGAILRQAERRQQSTQLVRSLRQAVYWASRLHQNTPTRDERARLARIAVRVDEQLRQLLAKQ